MGFPHASTNGGVQAAASKPRIMVLLEDPALTELLTTRLQLEGFETILFRDGREGFEMAEEHLPTMILFGLEKSVGYAAKFCRAIRRGRKTHEIPILVFADQVREAEAHTQLPEGVVVLSSRPLDVEALLHQIKPLSQRRIWQTTSADVVEHLGVCTDRIRHQAFVEGAAVHLTLTEFRLLDCFLRQPGRAFTRTDLVARAIGTETVVLERTIDVHIKSLRRKLGTRGALIETVRGIGYRFCDALLS